MLKLSSVINSAIAAVLVNSMIWTPVYAQDLLCRDVFASAAQSHNKNGQIKLSKEGAQIITTPEASNYLLDFKQNKGDNFHNDSCGDGVECELRPGNVEEIPFDIERSRRGDDVTVDEDEVFTFGEDGENEYKDVTVKSDAEVDFSDNFDEYYFKKLTVDEDAKVTLAAGKTYILEELKLGKGVDFIVSGEGTATVYSLKQTTFEEDAVINYPFTNNVLHFFSEESFDIKKKAKIGASLYSVKNVVMEEEAKIFGSVVVRNLEMKETSKITYDENIFNGDFDGLCEVQETSCDLHHFVIEQSSAALACPQSRPTVIVTAFCEDGTIKSDYAGTIEFSADVSDPENFNVYAEQNDVSPLPDMRYTFDGVDVGTRTFYFDYANVNEDFRIKVTDINLNLTNIASEGTDFRAAGLLTSEVSDFSCGTTSSQTFTLTAIGEVAGVSCQVLTNFQGNFPFKAAFQVDINNDGIDDSGIVSSGIILNDEVITDNTLPASDNITLPFIAGISTVDVNYLDVGRVLDIEFEHDAAPYQDSSLLGSTGNFLVSPAAVEFSFVDETNAECQDPSDLANCSLYRRTGETFDMEVAAVCADDSKTQAASYIESGLTLRSSLVAPASGTIENVLDTDPFDVAGPTQITRSADDVGVFDFELSTPDYFDQVPIADFVYANAGRFAPHHFHLELIETGRLESATGCDFTYIGEMNAGNGALNYGSDLPVFSIEARNSEGDRTYNYVGNYALLNKDGVSFDSPIVDASAQGVDGNPMTITSVVKIDEDDAANGTLEMVEDGKYELTLSEFDHFVYDHNGNANVQVAPFVGEMDIVITEVRDADGTIDRLYDEDTGNEISDNDLLIQPAGMEMRLGRWMLHNAYGSENERLPVPMQIEYFDGNNYVINQSEQCKVMNDDDATMTSDDLDVDKLDMDVDGSGSFEDGYSEGFGVTPYGTSGQALLEYDAVDWLLSDWTDSGSLDEKPISIVTFGLTRNSDRVIYRKESGNN